MKYKIFKPHTRPPGHDISDRLCVGPGGYPNHEKFLVVRVEIDKCRIWLVGCEPLDSLALIIRQARGVFRSLPVTGFWWQFGVLGGMALSFVESSGSIFRDNLRFTLKCYIVGLKWRFTRPRILAGMGARVALERQQEISCHVKNWNSGVNRSCCQARIHRGPFWLLPLGGFLLWADDVLETVGLFFLHSTCRNILWAHI